MALRGWVNIASGNGLAPVRRQAFTWTNAEFLSTMASEFSIKTQ